MTTILGLETSCDETAAAVVDDGRFLRSSVVFTQDDLHRRFGGVVPELASRQHVLGIIPAVEKALAAAHASWDEIDAVAVSYGPGLVGSLLVGVNAAKAIALARGVPLVGVNHLEGHVYANWLLKPDRWRPAGSGTPGANETDVPDVPEGRAPGPLDTPGAIDTAGAAGAAGPRREPPPPEFPLLCLIVSGGHSELVLMPAHGTYRLLGRTRDDAAGEAFDKVARILGLGYPGGPAIQRAAEQAGPGPSPAVFRLTRPWLRGTYDFSFSGLKTAVLRLVEGGASGPVGNPSPLAKAAPAAPPPGGQGGSADGQLPHAVVHLAASFQQTVVDVLVGKTCRAAAEFGVRQIALAGGVAANKRLRQDLAARAPVPVLCPDVDLCTDNAAMVAAAGFYRHQAGDVAGPDLDVKPNLRLA
jgi:N6-L-threonylcarbamoyladenine synthase